MGYTVAKYMVENGAKLVGVLEYDGSVYNADGICPDALKEYMNSS
jgi:glutamate dehydrogenase (NAD(P)+)